jgi:hypothetical protein
MWPAVRRPQTRPSNAHQDHPLRPDALGQQPVTYEQGWKHALDWKHPPASRLKRIDKALSRGARCPPWRTWRVAHGHQRLDPLEGAANEDSERNKNGIV